MYIYIFLLQHFHLRRRSCNEEFSRGMAEPSAGKPGSSQTHPKKNLYRQGETPCKTQEHHNGYLPIIKASQ